MGISSGAGPDITSGATTAGIDVVTGCGACGLITAYAGCTALYMAFEPRLQWPLSRIYSGIEL